MSLILCLARKQYRATVLEHNRRIFVKLERQLVSDWLLIGEKHLPGVCHTDVCVAALEEYLLIYDGSSDVLFVLDTKLNLITCLRRALQLDLTKASSIRYKSFFLLTEGRRLVILYEKFHKKHNMTYRCVVQGEFVYISTTNSTILLESCITAPCLTFQSYDEVEIHNYGKIRGAALCNGIIYALIKELLAPKYSLAVYFTFKSTETTASNWNIILRNVGLMHFFAYKHQLFALEFDAYNSVIYRFFPGQPYKIQYICTKTPLQMEKRESNIYANKGFIYTDSNKLLLRLNKFIFV
ncbi:Hypothetical protein GLP15_4730 [Giardia lamblia P15]|uniref:Uncharacterized protein n=1 Tax=Giardia intestinalis (strain P15) TaxID=658858 RepID=E1F1M8_GIAIA|nr:Hypothetical protein GLP15_4730 [Giardia lamblia P15]